MVLVSATLLLVGAFAVSLLSKRGPDQLAVVYVVPVMLSGLELGVLGGAGGAALAIVLLLAASARHSELEVVGLAASSASFLIAGGLAGRFSERMQAARNRQARLLTSGLRLARLDNFDALPTVLAEELEQVPAGRSFTPEDRVVAEKLALQAGVAADNQRLLAGELERAALHAELEHTRRRLADHLRNVGHVLESQEAERREIARHLHEQAAQALAGVLLGLRLLERDLDQEVARKQVEEVSEVARQTLTDLRQLAVSVRPPSLDDLGLHGALEGIAERHGTHGARRITLHCDTAGHDLAPEVEACAYRVAEEAIRALHGSLTLKLSVDHDRDALRIELDGRCLEHSDQLLARLAATRARLELLGGTLQTISTGDGRATILAVLPLHPTVAAASCES